MSIEKVMGVKMRGDGAFLPVTLALLPPAGLMYVDMRWLCPVQGRHG